MAPRSSGTSDDERGIANLVDETHIVDDWPRSIGFFGAFGAVGAALALDLVSMPIAVFVAAVPFLKLMNRPSAPKPQRFFSRMMDGAAQPVAKPARATRSTTRRRGAGAA